VSVYTDFQKFVNQMESSQTFKNWCAADSADCATWKTYRSAVLAPAPPSQAPKPPVPPAMSTPFGQALVDVGIMAIDAGLTPPPPPKPITAKFTDSVSGLTVAFTDQSTPGPSGPITGWHWDFGDGSTSTSKNPTHTYAAGGTYNVSLTVTGTSPDGASTATLPVSAHAVATAPKASFSYSATELAVAFTDTSTPGSSGPITAWHWDFGDGSTSTSQNPSHTYAAAGSYTVTLTVTGTSPDGTSTNPQTLSVSSGGGTPVPVGALIFNDEFNGALGTKPDTSKWIVHTGNAGLGLGVWVGSDNMQLDGNGNLAITAREATPGNPGGKWNTGFLSGKIGYSGKRYLETRAKVAAGYGTWNGPLWEDGFPWGANAIENDVVEQLGRDPQVNHNTLHNWTVSPNKQSGNAYNSGVILANDFHIYGAAVYADHVDYYLDGVKVFTALASAVGLSDLTTFVVAAEVQLNMGGWAGTPTIPGPVTLLIDYIRVYRIP
jgi:PKD repeat protein